MGRRFDLNSKALNNKIKNTLRFYCVEPVSCFPYSDFHVVKAVFLKSISLDLFTEPEASALPRLLNPKNEHELTTGVK